MKVAIITTDNRQQDRNYSTPAPYFGTAPEALLQGFAMIPEVEVHVISNAMHPMSSPQKLADNIWFHSVHVPKLGWLKTGYLGCIRADRRQLKALRPDIVHGQGTERDCAISAVFSGLPNVLTIHGNMRLIAEINHAKTLSFYNIAAQLEKFTLPRTRGVISITRYTRDAVADLAPKTWLLPNAVDRHFFDVNAVPDETRTILSVGVICYRKNQNALIRALDPLAGMHKFKLKFIGLVNQEHSYCTEFLELIAARPWCEYAGQADREKLRGHFKTASIVALSSLEDNCPMVVLEAMAAGVPVVAANVGGVPDLVQDGVNGLMCDPLSAESMRSAVEKLLANQNMARTLAATANRNAHERYHPLVVARKHLEIYREVLDKR